MQQEFTISCPISKIDEDQRIVYGYATVEEIDSQGDIVDYDASKRAFPEWAKIGNIREMHDKTKAIGKNFDVQFDDGKKAVLIGAKISESADGENAWVKVKEGILTGFSIGGRVNKIAMQTMKVKDEQVEVKRIMDYDLSEVSLVDNPAAPSAKLVMVKRSGGELKPAEVMERAADPHNDQWFRRYYEFGAGAAMIEKLNNSYAKNMKGQTMKKADDTKPAADDKATATPASKDPEVKVNKPGDTVEQPAPPADAEEGTQTVGGDAAHAAPQVTTAQRVTDASNPTGEGKEDLQPGPDNEGNPTPDEHPTKTTTEAAEQAAAGDPVKPSEPIQADSQTTTPKPDVAVPADGEGGTPAEQAKAAAAIMQKADFGKSMFGVAQLASLIDGLQWLRDCEKAEAAAEGDGSSIPQQLTDAIKNLGSILTAFATEEAAEAAEGRDLSDEFAYSKDAAGLAKAVGIAVAEAMQKVATPKTDEISKSVAESLTKVSDTISSIDARLKRIESSPVGQTAVRYQEVHKGGNGGEATKDAQIDALIEKGKNAKSAEERGEILMEIRRVQHAS